MCTQLSPEEFEQFLIPVIAPIYQVIAHQVKSSTYLPFLPFPFLAVVNIFFIIKAEITQLAEQVDEIVKQTVGNQKYMKAYQTIRKNAEASRLRRKRERALEVVVDPESAIKRKQQRNDHARKRRQQKYLQYKPHKLMDLED